MTPSATPTYACSAATHAREHVSVPAQDGVDLLSFGAVVLCSCSATLGQSRYEVVVQGGEVCDDGGLAL